MTGSIEEARTAIFARLEALHSIPGLHDHERELIADALRSLAFLEREEAVYQKHEKQRLLDEALQRNHWFSQLRSPRRYSPTIIICRTEYSCNLVDRFGSGANSPQA